MEVVRLERSRLDEASAVLARAFFDDPAWVWLLPDPERRARLLPWLFRIGFDITAAEVYATAGPVLGAARWLPPGRAPMRVGATLRALVTTPLRLGSATPQFLAYGRAVEALRAEATAGPHWYLAGIGVEPAARRQGIGGALLAPGHRRRRARRCAGRPADEQRGQPLVLRGHGFRTVREGETPKDGPHAWAMVKRP